MAFDVFDNYGAVVDQNPDRQGKAAQRHGVQGLSTRIHDQQGGDDRQRDRGENDQGQPPIAEKQKNHQGRQPGRHHPAHLHAVEGGLDEDRLVEQRLDRNARGNHLFDVGKGCPDAVDHRQGRDAAAFADGDQGARTTIDGD